jgi:asparagine synthase (glutamine-hydrolysing)
VSSAARSLTFHDLSRTTPGEPALATLAHADHPLDVRTLGARALLASPLEPHATPYCDVRARLADAPLELAPPPPEATSPSEAALLVRRQLEAAVDRALVGSRSVAVATGGGLDSSTLLALATRWARRTGGEAFAVALDFGGPGDDRPHLRALEAHLGCAVVRVRPEDAAERMALARDGVDAAPFTWPSGPMEVEMFARARARGADRVLTGVGADALFDGSPQALAAMAKRGALRAALRAARRLQGFSGPRAPGVAWVLRPLAAALVPTTLRQRRARAAPVHVPTWAGPVLCDVATEQAEAQIARAFAPCRSADDRFEAARQAPHLEHLAWLRHQEEVASGLARRDPFLDLTLVRAVTRLPPEWLLFGDQRRGLFREAVRDLLPASVATRQDKASFEPALTRFVRAAGGFEALRPLASVTELAALDLARPAAFREAFEAFAARPEDPDGDGWESVWPALAVEGFLRARRRGGARA